LWLREEPTREIEGIREALRPLRALYGRTPASEFGPRKLKAVRQQMIDSGLSRCVINHRVGRIKRLFKWAVAEELVPPSVYHGLQAVAGLTFGRTSARETEPIRPVPDLHVAAVLPFISPPVAAMIMLQRLTGMRPGEPVIMRPCDIDTSGGVWIYEPSDHKTRWRGHRKQIPLGPEAQRILGSFLDRDPQAFLFSPVESEQWRLENRPPYHDRERKTPIYPTELQRRQRLKAARRHHMAKRRKGERYDTNSYRRAIEYGLRKAKKSGFLVPHWHPHQLRHNRGTEVRRKYGIEAAQVALTVLEVVVLREPPEGHDQLVDEKAVLTIRLAGRYRGPVTARQRFSYQPMVTLPTFRRVVSPEVVVVPIDPDNPQVLGLIVAIFGCATARNGHVQLLSS
jgi:integrase